MRRSASEIIRNLEMRVARLEGRTASNLTVDLVFIAPGMMAVYVDTHEAPEGFIESNTMADVSYKIYPCKATRQVLEPVILATGGMFSVSPASGKWRHSKEEKIALMSSLGCKIPSEFTVGKNFELLLNEDKLLPGDL